MSGAVTSDAYFFQADSEILEEGTGGAAIDDTVPGSTSPASPDTTDAPGDDDHRV